MDFPRYYADCRKPGRQPGHQPYLYCGANPIGRVDPSGREGVPPWDGGAGAALVVAVVIYMLEFHDFFELRGPVTEIGTGYANRNQPGWSTDYGISPLLAVLHSRHTTVRM